MRVFRTSLLVCTGLAAIASTPAHAAIDEYSVEGSSRVTVNLEVCSAESQLAVRGDTGTDLDFYVNDAAGNSIHLDEGVDDYLSVVIEKEGEDCETFSLGVSNLGEESNDFTVVLEPITENSTRVLKHIVQANETKMVDFRACGTGATVSARGDGDTDLDFIIRNSDGAVVHENEDTTDETTAELAGLLSDCEKFQMEVANLGGVYNALMVVIEPKGAAQTPFAGTAPTTSLAEASIAIDDDGRSVAIADTSGEGEYRAEANTSLRVNLPVCSATRLEVRGDGDTDLDFTITDDAGDVVHSDFDMSDITFTTLEPGDACETYVMEVDNLGDVHNVFTVAFIDPGTRTGTAGPGEYRVNASAATKVALRVCEVTEVSARGDGDTDLDFDVTDSSGENVHSDYDMTDATQFTLDPGGDCADFALSVENLGEVHNLLTVNFGGDQQGYEARISRSKSDIAPPSPPIAHARTAPSPDGQDRSLTIVNRTGDAIGLIYWANAATLEWGGDRLGEGQILGANEEWAVNVFDGSNACLFNFRAVTAKGREVEVPAINVCEASEIVIE